VDLSTLKWFSYGFRNQADVEYLPTNRIVFELKEGRPLSEVRALAPDGVRFESAKYFRYVVAQSPDVDLLALANRIYESGLVEYAHPDFMVEKRRTADPLYDEQYYLNNTSSNLGTAGVDIDAPAAWNLTKGSSQIRVAVIDDGVEAHEDLENASESSRVLDGYTPQTSGNGRPVCDRCDVTGGPGNETIGHGVAVSGIIAATHNSTGVRGVAPNVKIVPVNIFTTGNDTPSEAAEGINWAWDEGNADVLSNSWGYPPSADFDVISNAIQDARTQGRNGRGSVVVFSAGNFPNGSQVTDAGFPADVNGVLGVGAVDKNDNRWYYTPSAGNDIDVVAPSGDTQLLGDVRTTDRMGTLGYERSSGDHYTPRFGGTSAAAPQAAGTAALMLSANSSLTESEVRAKIEATADDYGNTNWDGNGRLNAAYAVEEAYPPVGVQVSGPIKVKENETATWTAFVSGGSGNYDYYWKKKSSSNGIWDPTCYGATTDCTTSFPDDANSYNNTGGIRVIVTDQVTNSSATDELSVTIGEDGDDDGGGGGGGGGCNAVSTNQICLSARKKVLAPKGQPHPDTVQIGTVAPNPVRSRAELSVALPEREHVEVSLYNTLGQVIRDRTVVHSAGWHTVPIDLMGRASGMYFVRVIVGDVTKTRQVVVVQ